MEKGSRNPGANCLWNILELTHIFRQLVGQIQPWGATTEEFGLLHQSFSDHIRVAQHDHRMKAEIQPKNVTKPPPSKPMK